MKKISLLLLAAVFATAGTCSGRNLVEKAYFHQIKDAYKYFSDDAYYGHLNVASATMSGDGQVVAFWGYDSGGAVEDKYIFIHNVESDGEATRITLPSWIGYIVSNAGMVSNSDGTRIFFIAQLTENWQGYNEGNAKGTVFCMLNGLTGDITPIYYTAGTDFEHEDPLDIATDGDGNYLYFNESDTGDRGDLWKIAATGGTPERVIDADIITVPLGGVGRFIDQFDISHDGNTIVFIIEGRIEPDNTVRRFGRELYIKDTTGIRYITSNEVAEYDPVISGDGSTIVFNLGGSSNITVTTPTAGLNSETEIFTADHSCGEKNGITEDGSLIIARMAPDGTSACDTYLVKTDGSSRQIIDTPDLVMREFSGATGMLLSNDGARVFFKDRDYHTGSNGWYNPTVGVFKNNLWSTQVPVITGRSYQQDYQQVIEAGDSWFDTEINVHDPQGCSTIEDVNTEMLLDGKVVTSAALSLSPTEYKSDENDCLYTLRMHRGYNYPDDVGYIQYSVRDEDGNHSFWNLPMYPSSSATLVPTVLAPLLLQ